MCVNSVKNYIASNECSIFPGEAPVAGFVISSWCSTSHLGFQLFMVQKDLQRRVGLGNNPGFLLEGFRSFSLS